MNDEAIDPKRQTLIAALYGELDAEELAKFQALLDEDTTLRAEWEELRETRALLETATVNEPAYTPEFVFIDRSQREAKPKRRFTWIPSFSPAWGFAATTACLAIMMGAGLRMDRVDNGLVLRFGPVTPQQTAPAETVAPGQPNVRTDPPISTDKPSITPTAAVTRDDLNQYSDRMLNAVTRLMDDAQDRQRKEFVDLMSQFYEQMSKEQQRKYQSLVQRMDGIGIGLRYQQERTTKQITWLTDRMGGTSADSLATPRNLEKDK